MPADVARSARRAIASRKRCNDWFGGLADADDESTSSHNYFVQVLEETLSLLVGEDTGTGVYWDLFLFFQDKADSR